MNAIKLEKIQEREDAEYPNNITTGAVRIGYKIKAPEVGKRFIISDSVKDKYFATFMTSPVVEIIDEFTIKTVNSVYRITNLPNGIILVPCIECGKEQKLAEHPMPSEHVLCNYCKLNTKTQHD